VPSGLGFTGHVNDAGTGLVYMQQRYYDPIAGRFLSVDPVVTDANTGKMFGRYTYVENNPCAKIDPDGRESVGEMIDRDATEAAAAGMPACRRCWRPLPLVLRRRAKRHAGVSCGCNCMRPVTTAQ